MRAFVTGATGFVGSHLAEELHRQGWEVTCGVRRSSNTRWLDGKPFRQVQVDYADAGSVSKALEGVSHVFHVAGVITARSEREFLQGNWEVTRNVVRAAEQAGGIQRFVHFSSLAAAGPSKSTTPLDEATPCAPVSAYGRTKLRGELEVLAARDRLPVTVIRPPAVFGPRDPGLQVVYKIVNGGVVPRIGGKRLMSFVSVFDLVRAAVRAATEPAARGEVYFVCDEQVFSFREFIEAVARALDRRVRWVTIPPGVVRGLMSGIGGMLRALGVQSMISRDKANEAVQAYWICSGRKFATQFSMPAQIPFDEGIRQTVRWYVEQGLL